MSEKRIIKGGGFLIEETEADDIFIPEQFDEEQRMIGQSCQDFLDQEIYPQLDELDALQEGLMDEKLTKAGELGLLGISVPEEIPIFFRIQ